MVAVRTCGDQLALQIGFHCFVSAAGGSRYDFHACFCQSVLRAGTQAAADQNVNSVIRKKTGQGTMAQTVIADHLAGDDLAVFDLIDLKLFCSSEMLEDVSILISCCNFHSCSPDSLETAPERISI